MNKTLTLNPVWYQNIKARGHNFNTLTNQKSHSESLIDSCDFIYKMLEHGLEHKLVSEQSVNAFLNLPFASTIQLEKTLEITEHEYWKNFRLLLNQYRHDAVMLFYPLKDRMTPETWDEIIYTLNKVSDCLSLNCEYDSSATRVINDKNHLGIYLQATDFMYLEYPLTNFSGDEYTKALMVNTVNFLLKPQFECPASQPMLDGYMYSYADEILSGNEEINLKLFDLYIQKKPDSDEEIESFLSECKERDWLDDEQIRAINEDLDAETFFNYLCNYAYATETSNYETYFDGKPLEQAEIVERLDILGTDQTQLIADLITLLPANYLSNGSRNPFDGVSDACIYGTQYFGFDEDNESEFLQMEYEGMMNNGEEAIARLDYTIEPLEWFQNYFIGMVAKSILCHIISGGVITSLSLKAA